MVFHKDAPENEKLVFKRSVLGLGRVMYIRERERAQQLRLFCGCMDKTVVIIAASIAHQRMDTVFGCCFTNGNCYCTEGFLRA